MSILTWPAWMPAPQVGGYGIKPKDQRTKSEMDAGNLFRVEFDTDECEATCSLVLNALQANWFEAFERDMLRQGTAWFSMPLWVGGQVENHLVRFQARPEAGDLIGLHTTYSFTLDVAHRNIMNKAMAEMLYQHGPEVMSIKDWSFADRLHKILIQNAGLTHWPAEVAYGGY